MTRLLAVSFSLAACSGRAPTPTRPDEPRGSAEVVGAGSGSAGSGSAAPVETKVTEAECNAMIDHLIDVDVKRRPADQQIGKEEQAEIAAKLRTENMPACLKLPRDVVACVTAATTEAAIEACQP